MATEPSTLELEDIQNGALHPRPSPYVGVYILLRIDQPQAGGNCSGGCSRHSPPPPTGRS